LPFLTELRKDWWLTSIYLVPVVSAAALMALNINAPMADPDFYWHLAAGRWALEHARIPTADPFSFSCAGRPWVAHEWLFEAVLAAADRVLGYTGPVLLGHATFWAFSAFFYRWLKSINKNSPLAPSAVILPATVTLFPFWTLRPQIASYTFFVFFLAVLQKGPLRRGRLWALAALTAVWANTHGSFVLAPLTLLYCALCDFLSRTREGCEEAGLRPLEAAAAAARAAGKNWAAPLLAVLTAGALNPWGFSHYLYPLAVASDAAMKSNIAEWHSPNFHRPYECYLLFGWLLALICRPVFPRGVQVNTGLLGACALFTWLTLTSVRYAPYWVILLCGYLLSAGRPKTEPANGVKNQSKPVNSRQVALLWLVTLAFAAAAVFGHLPRGPVEAYVSPHFPQAAAEKLAAGPPGKRMLNHYNWGGYLIWRLWPKLPVFIDGRADLYAKDVFLQYIDAVKLKDPASVLEAWQFDLVTMPPDEPLVSWLRLNPAWEVWYEDEKSVIMKKAEVFKK